MVSDPITLKINLIFPILVFAIHFLTSTFTSKIGFIVIERYLKSIFLCVNVKKEQSIIAPNFSDSAVSNSEKHESVQAKDNLTMLNT